MLHDPCSAAHTSLRDPPATAAPAVHWPRQGLCSPTPVSQSGAMLFPGSTPALECRKTATGSRPEATGVGVPTHQVTLLFHPARAPLPGARRLRLAIV